MRDEGPCSDKWRSDWKSRYTNDRGTLDLDQLRAYLLGDDSAPQREGLIVLAHHGKGEIQAESEAPFERRISSQGEIKRKFGLPSVAILATCSVGAPGSAHVENNELIYSLNQGNIVAMIASPFKVPVPLAKRFMELLGNDLIQLETNKPFYEVFLSVRKKLKEAPESPTSPNTPHLRSIVDSFMLLGRGDVSICKHRSNSH